MQQTTPKCSLFKWLFCLLTLLWARNLGKAEPRSMAGGWRVEVTRAWSSWRRRVHIQYGISTYCSEAWAGCLAADSGWWLGAQVWLLARELTLGYYHVAWASHSRWPGSRESIPRVRAPKGSGRFWVTSYDWSQTSGTSFLPHSLSQPNH